MPSVTTKERRTAFELAVTRGAIAADKAVLGICGGMQFLNVALGGTLLQHIPDEWPNALAHEQPNPRTEPGHTVKVEPGTLLHRVTRMDEMPVNSAHHQAVKDAGPGLVIDARAPDGIVEGIEDPRRRFVLGVEWHPEYALSPGTRAFLPRWSRPRRTPGNERAHRQGAGARGPVLAPRGGTLDRAGPRRGRRRGADQPGARCRRDQPHRGRRQAAADSASRRACSAITSRPAW